MNCKKCEAELEEGMKFCPNCGAAQDEAEVEETITEVLAEEPVAEEAPVEEAPAEEAPAEEAPAKAGLGAGKIALLVVLAIAAIAVVIALIVGGKGGGNPAETTAPTVPAASGEALQTQPVATIPADGNPDDVTCKGSYYVSDEEIAAAADEVVATMGDAKLTNGLLQVYYWRQVYDFLNQYGGYISAFGLDYTQSLDTQISVDGTLTWQQYFLHSALESWRTFQSMSHAANEAGYVMDEEYAIHLENLPGDMEESALSMGYESADALARLEMGAGASVAGYVSYLETYYRGLLFYQSELEKMEYTDEEVEAYFDKHAAEYLENGLEKTDEIFVDVRHILIGPEGGTTDESGATVYSDAEWAAAEKKANDILNEWLTKNPTEDGFAVLAQTYSVDSGSASNGGLYEGVFEGQMVEPFENWCFDPSRQYGDYGIVKTTYGFHIMFFVDSELAWFLTAEQDMMVEKGNAFVEENLAKYPAQIDYSAIKLGNVDLAAAG